MRTFLIRLLLLAAVLFVLSACGSDTSADETSADESPQSPDISTETSSDSDSGESTSSTTTTTSETSDSDTDTSVTTDSKPETTAVEDSTTSEDTKPDTSGAPQTTEPEDDEEEPPDSSTPDSSTPDTTADTAPPELPSHEFTITYSGSGGAQDVHTRNCRSTCVVEIFSSQYGASNLRVSTTNGTPARISSDGGCLIGDEVWLLGSVGSTCTIGVAAPATAEYKQSSAEFVFKATAAAYFTWEDNDHSVAPGASVAPGTPISFELEVQRDGVDWGGIWIGTVNGDANQYDPLENGVHTIILTAGDCGQETAVTFGIDMGGPTFGDGTGPSKLSWTVAACSDGGDDEQPDTTTTTVPTTSEPPPDTSDSGGEADPDEERP